MDRTGGAVSRREARWWNVAALGLCLLVLGRGIQVTHDLQWPAGTDLYRDLAAAQSFVDCRCFADPLYRGAWLWYNPLTPAVVGVASVALRLPVHIVATRIGAYVNLLAPTAFYAMVVMLAGHRAAIGALVAFLFLMSGEPELGASYAPWILPANFVQAFFYLTVAVYATCSEKQAMWRWIAAGALLGLTFLGHTAPAMVFAGILVADTVITAVRDRSVGVSLAVRVLLLVAAAIAVASPFLFVVVWKYGAHVHNRLPTFWVHPALSLDNLGTFAWTQVVRAVMVPIAIGLLETWNSQNVRSRRIILAWVGWSLVLLAYSYVWQALLARGVVLPSVVPGFHFARLLESGESVLFGVGVASAVQLASNAWLRGRPRLEPIALCLLLIASVAAVWPAWVRRPDFTTARIESLRMYSGPDFSQMFRWLRSSSRPDDVFLAPENLGLSVIGAAGRKVVVVDPFFSNPFVDWESRHRDAERMWADLDAPNCNDFLNIAARYDVSYVATRREVRSASGALAACGLQLAFPGREWSVFRVQRPEPQTRSTQ
jgi:hypothetical protein